MSAIGTEETKVEISIEASQRTGAITATANEAEFLRGKLTGVTSEAQKTSAGLGEMDKATADLSAALTGMVSAGAIALFFKEAVEESLHEAEALRVLKGSVESTGASWEKYKDQIEEFAKAQQANTRFQDDVTYEVLGKLALATKSVGEALRATALAENLAVATGKPLAETTNVVNMLLLGQERAVKLATKEFGNYAGGATTAQQALDNLQKSTRGAADAEVSAAKSFAQMKAEWGDTIQIVGDALVPVLVDMAVAIRDIIKATQEHLGFTKQHSDANKEHVKVLTEERDALIASASSLSTHGAATEESVKAQDLLRAAIAAKTAELEKAQQVENAPGPDDKLTARDDKGDEEAAQKKIDLQKQIIDATRQMTDDEFDYKRNKIEEEVENYRLAGVDKNLVESYRSAAIIELGKAEVVEAKKREKEKQEIEKLRKANFSSTLEFISTLSTAKNKELAIIGKIAGIGNAYINTGVAVTRALAAAPPPFNFALAAAVGAAGAAQIATIAGVQLEKGGVVPGTSGGTDATIGEKGKPEAVLPLTDTRAMAMVGKAISEAGGGGGGGNTFNLYVTAGPTWREIMDALIEAADRDPEMVRLARKLGDLNELHAGRAS